MPERQKVHYRSTKRTAGCFCLWIFLTMAHISTEKWWYLLPYNLQAEWYFSCLVIIHPAVLGSFYFTDCWESPALNVNNIKFPFPIKMLFLCRAKQSSLAFFVPALFCFWGSFLSLSAAALTSLVQGLLLKRELSEDQKERCKEINVNKRFIRGFTADHKFTDLNISLSLPMSQQSRSALLKQLLKGSVW